MAGVFDSLGSLDGVILSVRRRRRRPGRGGWPLFKIAPFIRITGGTIAGRKVNLPAVLRNVVIGADPTNTQSGRWCAAPPRSCWRRRAEAAFYLGRQRQRAQ